MKIGWIATGIWGSIHLDLAQEMVRQGHDVAIYTEDDRAPSGMRFTLLTEHGIQFWVIHGFRRNPLTWLPDRLLKFWLGRRFFTTLVAIWRFVRAHRDYDVFVVESGWLGFFVAIAGVFEPIRWVVGVHDTDYLNAPVQYPGRPQSKWRTAAQLWTLRRADIVRANSFVTRDALVAGGCPADKIVTIPLHYLPGRMLPDVSEPMSGFRARSRAAVRRELDVPQDAELLMTMCRLTPVKRLELAIEAVACLAKSRPGLTLAICGGDRNLPGIGSYAGQLRKLAERLGVGDRVRIAGEIDAGRVKEYLAAADLHLAPSWVDTFNYAVVEAALVGTYSLTSTGVGATHWVAEAGGARTLSGGSAEEWEKAIAALLEAPQGQEAMSNCRDRVIAQLSPAAVAARLVQSWAP